MFSFYLTICVTNICLGYGLAVYLKQPSQKLSQVARYSRKKQRGKSEEPQTTRRKSQGSRGDTPTLTEEIPEQWLNLLEEENIVAGSFVEATAEVLRLEVGLYRDKLIDIDLRVRKCSAEPTSETIRELLEELREVNDEWLKQQAVASHQLSVRSNELGEFEESGSRLEEVLMDQAAQIETTSSNIDMLEFDTDMKNGCRRLITEIRKLIDLAHDLRFQMYESLLAIVVAENRLEEIDHKLHTDAVSGIHNRTGMQAIFHELWSNDPKRVRQVSCAMIDVDQFAQTMESHGAEVCDKLIIAFSSLMLDLVRKERGFDVVCQYNGQRFFAFYGDTGPQEATCAAERIRQTFAASQFEIGKEQLEFTVTGCVTEVLNSDTTASIFNRLNKTLRKGKKEGRNLTVLNTGKGFRKVDAPDYDVKGRIFEI